MVRSNLHENDLTDFDSRGGQDFGKVIVSYTRMSDCATAESGSHYSALSIELSDHYYIRWYNWSFNVLQARRRTYRHLWQFLPYHILRRFPCTIVDAFHRYN